MNTTSNIDAATTSRALQITKIIEKRRPLAEKIETVENNLKNLSDALVALEKQRDQLIDKVDDPAIADKLGKIDYSDLKRTIEIELNALASLKSRFSRNTLNIGVVGRARQGKSRLLQSLTGLSQSEIPDGSGQHCTGVRSNIYHKLEVTEPYAEVRFHNERSFLDEVIAPYYRQLELGRTPHTIQDFANNPLPKLPKELAEKSQAAAKYEHLYKYYQQIESYRDALLESSPHRRISQNEIREYVAQDTMDGKRDYFNYLAVREVDIVCCFPHVDIGQIALVDMPGLGDTGIGDEERMIKTLGQDIDFVLFVRMPKPTGDFWGKEDVELYEMASDALKELPIKEWSFMVLNQLNDIYNNRNNCESLKNNIAEKHINVQRVIIANCADSDEAQEKILAQVLDYLGNSIEQLDNKYANACKERLANIYEEVNDKLEKANNVWRQAVKDDWYSKYVKLFNKFWKDLTKDLENLISSMSSKRDVDDNRFKLAVKAAIAECRSNPGIPSLQEIQEKAHAEGAKMSAYAECLHEVRTHLSKQFLSLDIALKKSLEEAKSDVVKVMTIEGRLGKIAEGTGSDFLKKITEKIPEHLDGLKLGFETLATFELQYRGLVQHRIRKHLDVLIPDRTPYKLEAGFFNKSSPPHEKIESNLKKAQAEAVNNCEKELNNLLKEPSQAGFAIIEEFVDRVLRAENVRMQWEIFLQEIAEDVWSDEYKKSKLGSQLKEHWLDKVKVLERSNKSNALDI